MVVGRADHRGGRKPCFGFFGPQPACEVLLLKRKNFVSSATLPSICSNRFCEARERQARAPRPKASIDVQFDHSTYNSGRGNSSISWCAARRQLNAPKRPL